MMNPKEFEYLPKMLRVVMIFIDRVGFPVLAFIMMFVLCVVYVNRNTEAIMKNTEVLTEIKTQLAQMK